MDRYYLIMSQREREIAALVATAASNKEIARELGISIKTVKNTLSNVFVKTGARSRTELALLLVQQQSAHAVAYQASGNPLDIAQSERVEPSAHKCPQPAVP